MMECYIYRYVCVFFMGISLFRGCLEILATGKKLDGWLGYVSLLRIDISV